ncbi:hypothetical protein [Tessaracoccus palaemonis]|uniref:Uncharacterized protein n=1 Tax=Tessaracoccus palaemonis TaxID=2829499 RepID=A0ABX8SHC9_9ACTN|nr:hypothetical protein [Tessaracoccus palaemonis]QXT62726.1 hypothetical protein KDB89_13485 [Tessaracoccus palaemonis]
MSPLDVLRDDHDDLDDFLADHHHSVELVSELLTVLVLLITVATLIGLAWLAVGWWTA